MNRDTMFSKLKKKGGAEMKECGGIYGLALIGALVYYIQHATSFLNGCLGVLKAIVWPAMLMYKVLSMLNM
ncbi:MAG: hypothetical protein WC527_00665 [Candidatus Margulisiibacteriota bacterium]